MNIGQALQLSPDEKEHLFNLAYNEALSLPNEEQYNDSLQVTIDDLPFPSFITDQRSKVIFWNRGAETMLFPFSSCASEERYLLQLLFLEEVFGIVFKIGTSFQPIRLQSFGGIYDRFPEDPPILNQLVVNLKQQSKLFQNLWEQHHIEQKKVSFISINNEQGQTNHFRIHSATHVDGNEDLFWCMYVPVS
ncbi:hypothetical protein [Gracilibacillus sp. JCM 18860]|uniref:MmyB family transcriptional regulator n=1 Tax=Gracilibacillus sp. JCM 18860 TaxID=1306159 RepID=UPI000AD3C738